MTDLTLHQSLYTAHYSVVKYETSLVYIYQLKLDQFAKMIILSRVGTHIKNLDIEHNGVW